jgi:FkbM family methyltransferase
MVSLNEESQARWQSEGKEYLRYAYDLKPDDVVIDIGAYRGEWAEGIYQHAGCRIICVEPNDSILGFRHGEIINKAASDHDGWQKFGGAFYYTSSFEPGNLEYECFDVKPLFDRFDEIALVKVNIEGAEYKLLSYMIDNGIQHKIKDLQVQFHEIEGDYLSDYEAICSVLNLSHELTYDYPFCWQNWRRKCL